MHTKERSFLFGSGIEHHDAHLVIIGAFEHLIESFDNYMRVCELDTTFDSEEALRRNGRTMDEKFHAQGRKSFRNYDRILQERRTEEMKRSGFRIKNMLELRELKEVYCTTPPQAVPHEVNVRTSEIFSDLLLEAALDFHRIDDISHEDRSGLYQDLRMYSAALHVLGDSKFSVAKRFPFNDNNE